MSPTCLIKKGLYVECNLQVVVRLQIGNKFVAFESRHNTQQSTRGWKSQHAYLVCYWILDYSFVTHFWNCEQGDVCFKTGLYLSPPRLRSRSDFPDTEGRWSDFSHQRRSDQTIFRPWSKLKFRQLPRPYSDSDQTQVRSN